MIKTISTDNIRMLIANMTDYEKKELPHIFNLVLDDISNEKCAEFLKNMDQEQANRLFNRTTELNVKIALRANFKIS